VGAQRALLETSLKEDLRERITRTKREAEMLYDAMNEQHSNLRVRPSPFPCVTPHAHPPPPPGRRLHWLSLITVWTNWTGAGV
jgi:hypothetical protein